MSLINEALKRTRDASYNAVVPPPAMPSYRVPSETHPGGSRTALLFTILVAIVAIGGIIGLTTHVTRRVAVLKTSFESSAEPAPTVSQPKQVETPSVPVAATPTAPAKVQASPAEPKPSNPAAEPKTSEDQLVDRVVEKIKAEQATAAATPEPPKFVLQGITYAPDGGEAMINGQSVRAGDDIEGAHVVAIDRRSVKLDCSGREVVLRLP